MSTAALGARRVSTALQLSGTGRGLLVATLAATLLAALGLDLARPLAALGAAALLVAALLGLAHTRALELSELRPARGAVGSRVRLFLSVRRGTRLFAPRQLLFRVLEPGRDVASPAGFVSGPLTDTARTVELVWRPRRRGRLERLELAVVSEHPLGLVRVTRRFELAAELLGLPRRGRLAHEPAADSASVRALRGRRARGEEELEHVRDWRPGESLRRLHWRLSARRGRPILRELAAPTQADVELVLCTAVAGLEAQRTRRQAFERAVSLAATLAEHYLRAGRRLTLAIQDGPRLGALSGRRGLARALALLASVEPRVGGPALALAPRSGVARIAVLAGGGSLASGAALAPRTPGVRIFDVDAPHGHPHRSPWREAPRGAGSER